MADDLNIYARALGEENDRLRAENQQLRDALFIAQEALALTLPTMRGQVRLAEAILGEQAGLTIVARQEYRAVEAAVIKVTTTLAAGI